MYHSVLARARERGLIIVFIIDVNSEIGCAPMKQSFFDMFKVFDKIESNYKSFFFVQKDLFSFMSAQHVLTYHLIQVPLG